MALVSTIIKQTVIGDRKLVIGSFTNDTTSGDIITGLQVVETLIVQHTGATVVADSPAVDETLPLGGLTPVTIKTTSAKAGIWIAIGY